MQKEVVPIAENAISSSTFNMLSDFGSCLLLLESDEGKGYMDLLMNWRIREK